MMSNIPKSVSDYLEKSLRGVVAVTTERLSAKYGFDFEEAMAHLASESVLASVASKKKSPARKKSPAPKRAVPEMPLPFCGVVNEDWCHGVKFNQGLMTQCTMPAVSDKWCKTCAKQVAANDNNLPNYGCIDDRVGNENWTAPNGKKVVPYHKVFAKLGVEKSEAEAEAAKFGWTIPEDSFEEPKKEETPKADAKRGRPKKVKKTVSSSKGDDLIAALVAQAQEGSAPVSPANEVQEQEPKVQYLGTAVEQAEAKKTKKVAKKPKMTAEEKEAAKQAKAAEKEAAKQAKEAEKEAAKQAKAAEKEAAKQARATEKKQTEEAKAELKAANAEQEDAELQEEEYQEEATKVEKFEHDGKTYLRAADNMLYDMETHEPVGVWNAADSTIGEFSDEED
jgi:hypothetical protein